MGLKAMTTIENTGATVGNTVDAFQILRDIKRIRKSGDLTNSEISLLEYYICFTKKQDWQPGQRPVVWQSLTKTALQLGISDRQVQRLEASLIKKGYAVHENDGSGNYKRFGYRDRLTGDIVRACGINLAPLSHKHVFVLQQIEVQEQHDQDWLTTKGRISRFRAQINRLLKTAPCPALANAYQAILKPIRAYMSLEALNALLKQHKALYDDIQALFEGLIGDNDQEKSSSDDTNVVYIQSTNTPKSSKEDCNGLAKECNQSSGLSGNTENITENQLIKASSTRFKESFAAKQGGFWARYIETAYEFLDEIGISRRMWKRACNGMSREAAAIMVMLIDEKISDGQKIHNPSAYLNGKLKNALTGKLNLTGSIIGALDRQKI